MTDTSADMPSNSVDVKCRLVVTVALLVTEGDKITANQSKIYSSLYVCTTQVILL